MLNILNQSDLFALRAHLVFSRNGPCDWCTRKHQRAIHWIHWIDRVTGAWAEIGYGVSRAFKLCLINIHDAALPPKKSGGVSLSHLSLHLSFSPAIPQAREHGKWGECCSLPASRLLIICCARAFSGGATRRGGVSEPPPSQLPLPLRMQCLSRGDITYRPTSHRTTLHQTSHHEWVRRCGRDGHEHSLHHRVHLRSERYARRRGPLLCSAIFYYLRVLFNIRSTLLLAIIRICLLAYFLHRHYFANSR